MRDLAAGGIVVLAGMPCLARTCLGAGVRDEFGEREPGDLGGPRLVATRHGAYRRFGAFGRAGEVTGRNRAASSTRRAVGSGASCSRSCLGAVTMKSRSWFAASVQALMAAAGHSQHPDRLHSPVVGLRRPGGFAVEGGQRGGDRVGGVGRAPAAGQPVRPDYLGYLHALAGQAAAPPRHHAIVGPQPVRRRRRDRPPSPPSSGVKRYRGCGRLDRTAARP